MTTRNNVGKNGPRITLQHVMHGLRDSERPEPILTSDGIGPRAKKALEVHNAHKRAIRNARTRKGEANGTRKVFKPLKSGQSETIERVEPRKPVDHASKTRFDRSNILIKGFGPWA